MGVLDRFTTIMKSNINALLDKAEDPEKMIDQALRDAREDLAEVRKETANLIASANAANKDVSECEAKVAEYTSAAKNALKAGNEADARTLLAKKQEYETALASYKQTASVIQAKADQMREMHEKLMRDISTLETKKDTIKAKMAAAKAQQHVNDVLAGGKDAKVSLETFDRMSEKADQMLEAANAESELLSGKSSEEDLLDKYQTGAGGASVDAELERMKQELGL